jgi:hypothetical protein
MHATVNGWGKHCPKPLLAWGLQIRFRSVDFNFLFIVLKFNTLGWLTCDNATNNGTMMVEFAFQIRPVTGRKYDAKERRFGFLSDVSSSMANSDF